ncbi:MAG: hypothetical protein V4712_14175 [Pseudomonadota bacterium]
MFKTFTLPRVVATSLLVLMPMAAMAAPIMVKSVEVDVALADVTNTTAAARFANLKPDLENAIATRLVDRTDAENGAKIMIDISELELSNGFTDVFNLADTKLDGVVQIVGTAENPLTTRYELKVDVNTAMVYFPEGTDMASLPADSAVYYDAAIAAFADNVVKKLDE